MLKPGFLRNKHTLTYGGPGFFKSVVIGVIASLAIYSFLCGLRLLFRSMEFGISNGPHLIEESARYWQNFNFALIALSVGNGAFLGTFFRRPSLINIPKYKRGAIVVDQVFLSFNFFHLFFKIFFMLSVMSMMALDLKVLGASTYLYVLIAIVLFLEGYKTIIVVYRTKIYKMVVIHLIVLTVSTFALANTSIFDFHKIDELLMSRNPKVEIPVTHWREKSYANNSHYLKVFSNDGILTYNANDTYISLKDLPMIIRQADYLHYPEPTIYLLIEKNISMLEVTKLKRFLSGYNLTKVIYVVSDLNQVKSRFDLNGISKTLPPIDLYSDSYPNPPMPPPSNKEWLKRLTIVNVEIRNDGSISTNDFNSKSFNESLTYFKTQIGQDVFLNFIFDEQQITYQQYIDVYSTYRNAIDDLRKSYLKELGHEGIKDYQVNYDSIMRRVKSKYPLRQLDNYIPDLE